LSSLEAEGKGAFIGSATERVKRAAIRLLFVRVAFFDLDKTLLAENSGSLWIRRQLREGRITRWQALRAGWLLARYHLGFAAIEDALLEAVASLAGSSSEGLRERTRVFYEQEVRALYRPGARAALTHHRSRGDQLVLLTTSTHYLSELVQKELSLDAVLCNELGVDADGAHTGTTVKALCFGPGKLAHAADYLAARGVAVCECAFYTDSFSDLPMMEVVGLPVAVNPDRLLRREAERRGWQIVDWGRPE
jgi:HAD superfamily hydrolase (TIGR01490 family)